MKERTRRQQYLSAIAVNDNRKTDGSLRATVKRYARYILRKEVIQPQVPLRLPCYDFTPVADPTVAGRLLKG
jgi:hypothetical protein